MSNNNINTALIQLLQSQGYTVTKKKSRKAVTSNVVAAKPVDPEKGLGLVKRREYALANKVAGRYCAKCNKGYAYVKKACPKCEQAI